MTTNDEIIIMASPDAIFRVAADVRQWPKILPHYRRVKVLAKGEDSLHVEMAARRGWIPVSWTAVQRCDPAGRQIHYRHTGGLTKGMTVVWEITPLSEGSRVVITHDLTLETPIVRTWPGQLVVAYGFVHYIASRTLRIMKRHLEQGTRVAPPSPIERR